MKDIFKIHKRKNEDIYYITYNGKKVTMKYIPKMIKKITMDTLRILGECNGKINNSVSGRLVEFPTKEDAEKAKDYLCSTMVAEKLFDN